MKTVLHKEIIVISDDESEEEKYKIGKDVSHPILLEDDDDHDIMSISSSCSPEPEPKLNGQKQISIEIIDNSPVIDRSSPIEQLIVYPEPELYTVAEFEEKENDTENKNKQRNSQEMYLPITTSILNESTLNINKSINAGYFMGTNNVMDVLLKANEANNHLQETMANDDIIVTMENGGIMETTETNQMIKTNENNQSIKTMEREKKLNDSRSFQKMVTVEDDQIMEIDGDDERTKTDDEDERPEADEDYEITEADKDNEMKKTDRGDERTETDEEDELMETDEENKLMEPDEYNHIVENNPITLRKSIERVLESSSVPSMNIGILKEKIDNKLYTKAVNKMDNELGGHLQQNIRSSLDSNKKPITHNSDLNSLSSLPLNFNENDASSSFFNTNYLAPTSKSFVIDSDIIACINDFQINIPDYQIPEPDWGSLQQENDTEIDNSWEIPTKNINVTDTIIPPEMDCIEFLSRLDYYQQSVKIYTDSLKNNHNDEDFYKKITLDGSSLLESLLPYSNANGTIPLRSKSKRNAGMKTTININKLFKQPIIFNTDSNNTVEAEMEYYLEQLKNPYTNKKHLQRPYMPFRVWEGTNWEDWAQFEFGNIIHVPFNEIEDRILIQKVDEFIQRYPKFKNTVFNDVSFWSELSILLPGRSPQDCEFRYMDIDEPKSDKVFGKTFMVSRDYEKNKIFNSYHKLTKLRSINRRVPSSIHHSTIWQNLSHESTIGEGSGDALCVTILNDNYHANGIHVFTGSLCSDDPTYNVEGNLRVWNSYDNSITQLKLKGHCTTERLRDGTTQDIWRTVNDVKLSNNKKILISASRDKYAKVWDCEEKSLRMTLKYHKDVIYQIATHENENNIFATASADGDGVIWRLNDKMDNGTGVACVTDYINRNGCSADCVEFGRGPSNQLIYFGYRGKSDDKLGWINAFNATDGESLFHIDTMNGSVGCLSLSHSGKYILSGNDGKITGDQMMHLHDARTGEFILSTKTGHLDVNTVIFSPCDNYIVSGSVANEIAVFDIRRSSNPLYKFAHGNEDCTNNGYLAPDSGMGIAGIHWLNSCPVLVTGGSDCMIKLWDVAGGNGILKSYQTSNPINCVSIDEDLKVLAVGVSGAQGIVHIWQP